MIVLGLHKDPWHNSGAAMIRDDGDGPKFAYVAEERLDRVKDSRAFPERATRACMNALGVDAFEDIDVVVMDYIIDGRDWRRDCFRTPARLDVFLAELPPDRIHIVNHHVCHAHAVFYSSPYDEAAILVVDGRGSDKETQSLYHARRGRIDLIESTDAIGIGLLYAAVTQAIGFRLLQEGKTMGLAPYGAGVKKKIFDFKGVFDGMRTDYGAVCIEGSYDLKGFSGPLRDFEDRARAAFEVQAECEKAMLHLSAYARERTGCEHLCVSGGVGLNSVANYVILRSGLFRDIFINPAASDTGIPLGAALYGYHTLAGRPRTYRSIPAFLGPAYEPDRIRRAVRRFNGYEISTSGALEKACALLADNRIVACFQGRSEMGPRALGHRSILMSPLKADNKDVLNARVKHREPFRPFAPAALEEEAHDYFELDRPSPYMLLVPDVREDKRSVIPAVTHVDGSARLQTVTSDRNPLFRPIIEGFRDLTGVPVLLNTSFNVNGEPIVETPEDAIRCFLGTNIDALLIDDTLLLKSS